MTTETFLDGRVTLHHGDSRDVLKGLADASIDSAVMDPPYALVSIGKRFGKPGSAAAKAGTDGLYQRASAGFMGQAWDTGETAFAAEFWAEVLRVLKPGSHLVAFSGTRTYHRMAVAIEDAGFEIRDQLAWVYGTGFPKSHDVAKGIDKTQLGVVRGRAGRAGFSFGREYERNPKGAPISDDAKLWDGWGTALKPAWEPIVLARKPIDGTVAANVLRHGVGALNIDGCRVAAEDAQGGFYTVQRFNPGASVNAGAGWKQDVKFTGEMKPGRWPANIVHDGSDEVASAFPFAPGQLAAVRPDSGSGQKTSSILGAFAQNSDCAPRGDTGSAARFFYSAKADADDRIGSKHPTVKPVDLMQWLCRLVTPPGGVVLDAFAGTGTTGEAAYRDGFRAVLIEREEAYCADIRRRLTLAAASKTERRVESLKARDRVTRPEDLPLFAGNDDGTPPPSRGWGRQIYGRFADQDERLARSGSSDE